MHATIDRDAAFTTRKRKRAFIHRTKQQDRQRPRRLKRNFSGRDQRPHTVSDGPHPSQHVAALQISRIQDDRRLHKHDAVVLLVLRKLEKGPKPLEKSFETTHRSCALPCMGIHLCIKLVKHGPEQVDLALEVMKERADRDTGLCRHLCGGSRREPPVRKQHPCRTDDVHAGLGSSLGGTSGQGGPPQAWDQGPD